MPNASTEKRRSDPPAKVSAELPAANRAALDRRLSEMHDHEFFVGQHDCVLPLITVAPKAARKVGPQPPVCPVVETVGIVSRPRAGVVAPTDGKYPGAICGHPIVAVQLAEAAEVACGGVHVTRSDKRARGIELRRC